MAQAFPIRDVSTWDVVKAETLGRDRKVWLREPGTPAHAGSHERDWLFKPVVVVLELLALNRRRLLRDD